MEIKPSDLEEIKYNIQTIKTYSRMLVKTGIWRKKAGRQDLRKEIDLYADRILAFIQHYTDHKG